MRPSVLSHFIIAELLNRRVTELTDAPVEFGLIPHDDWFQPEWIDEDRATKARDDMVKNQVIYGGTCHSRIPRRLFITLSPFQAACREFAFLRFRTALICRIATGICVVSTLE